MAQRSKWLQLFLLAFTFSLTCAAQDLPDVAQGLQPYAAYHGGELDQVSLINGGLTVRIPLVSYPQKGSLSLSYSVLFNSFAFQDLALCDDAEGQDGPLATIPVRAGCTNTVELAPTVIPFSVPLSPRLVIDQQLSSAGITAPENNDGFPPPVDGRFYIIESDNSEHALAPTSTGYRSIDESGYLFVPSSAPQFGTNLGGLEHAYSGDTAGSMGYAAGTITDAHGIIYQGNTITDPDGMSSLLVLRQ